MAVKFNREHYKNLWNNCFIPKENYPKIDKVLNRMSKMTKEYKEIERLTGVPYYIVAAIHEMEASCRPNVYLGNGDSLFDKNGNGLKSVNVPKGRGPFKNFIEGALDALTASNRWKITDWSIEHVLFKCETYNGMGYWNNGMKLYGHPINSPYLWAGSNNYGKKPHTGRYVGDGNWQHEAISQRIGIGTILKYMEQKGYFNKTVLNDVFEVAKKYIGVKEIAGEKHNPVIVNFFKNTTGKEYGDEVSWCSAFVSSCLQEAGFKHTGKLNARSYLTYGVSVKNNPKQGDIVVFWRNSPESWEGHVGFYAGENEKNILVLGGNQGNQVSIAEYPKSRLLDIRRPLDEKPVKWDTAAFFKKMDNYLAGPTEARFIDLKNVVWPSAKEKILKLAENSEWNPDLFFIAMEEFFATKNGFEKLWPSTKEKINGIA